MFFLALSAGAYFALISYVKWYVAWENSQRRGMDYYGKKLAERRRIRRQIKLYSLFMPAAVMLEKLNRAATKKVPPIPSIEFQGMAVPSYSCNRESLERAKAYTPQKSDIFIATQMKCGTT